MRLDQLNAVPADILVRELLACCDAPAWAEAVVRGRPYPNVDAVLAAADAAARGLGRSEVERAVAAHPRIGERPGGGGTRAAWSRQEQGAVDPGLEARRALAEGNAAYEARFDRVFLVCASGLTAEQVLDRLRTRLRNDDETEVRVVADELRRIAVLRVGRLLESENTARRGS